MRRFRAVDIFENTYRRALEPSVNRTSNTRFEISMGSACVPYCNTIRMVQRFDLVLLLSIKVRK